MSTNVVRSRPAAPGVWWPRLASVLVWGVVGYGAVYWGLRLTRDAGGPARAPLPAPPTDIDSQAVARALGAAGAAAAPVRPAAPDAASRYALTGVLAGGSTDGAAGGHGVALIAVDGGKPRPFAVGAVVDGSWVVRRVTARVVELRPIDGAPGAAGLTLHMPEPKPLPSAEVVQTL